jgi:hypothetical protein
MKKSDKIQVKEVVYICKECEAIYLETVSECDCSVGKRFEYYIGELTYEK